MESKLFTKFGRVFIISILALGSLGAFIYPSDVIAAGGNGNGNGGGNGNGNGNSGGSSSANGSNDKAKNPEVVKDNTHNPYEEWLEELLAE